MTYEHAKRGMDFLGALVLLVVSLPCWVLTTVTLLLVQGRPLFYRQLRVGRHGQPFFMLKFRTMRDGAPRRLPDRPVTKDPRDPRVTPFGGLLRRFALDELPQLINVLRGEMSLVGPRPLPKEDLDHPGWLANLTEEERARRLAWCAQRQQAPPGLTGLWQITPNAAEDFDNWIASDMAYLAVRSLPRDLLILLQTPWAVLRGRAAGAQQAKERVVR